MVKNAMELLILIRDVRHMGGLDMLSIKLDDSKWCVKVQRDSDENAEPKIKPEANIMCQKATLQLPIVANRNGITSRFDISRGRVPEAIEKMTR